MKLFLKAKYFVPLLSTKVNNIRFSACRTFIEQAEISNDKNKLIVQFKGNTEVYPTIWLRDNCTCTACLHYNSQSRVINWNEFDVNVTPNVLQVNKDGIHIKWSDNHESSFTHNWLKERSFSKAKQNKYLEENYIPKKILWDGSEFQEICKRYDYRDVITKGETLYHFLHDLAVYGVALLKNAPLDKEETIRLSQRIGFIRETHYGKQFVVTNKPETNNVAYLSGLLQMHTDLPYYHNNPGATFLHCIVQTESEGGQNLLTDGFYVAEKLRRENKEYFDLLSTVDVNWSDYGEEDNVKFCKIFRSPILSLHSNKEIACVRYSIPQRDSIFTADVEKVRPWYFAAKTFHQLLNEHAAKFKLLPGDILAFDNQRLTHGRTKYDDTEKNRRLLYGMYVDWDEIFSHIRLLRGSLRK